MTLSERLEILSEVVNNDNTARRISQVAAIQVIAEYKQRIFLNGLDSSGSAIGQYSVNPFYINPLTLTTVKAANVTPQGKNGNTVFKNGNAHKTRYLTQGYKELRQLIGANSETVDLNFSGSLFESIKVTESGTVSAITYTNDEMAGIMEYQESAERFGKEISTVSTDERELGETAARNELLAILEEIDLL
jgi:hypothetical protein